MKPNEAIPAAPKLERNDLESTPDISNTPKQSWIDLAAFRNDHYSPGRNLFVRATWYVTSLIFFESGCFPFSSFKTLLLRLFGARIGRGLVIKPQVRIKYPWRLTVGNHCWIGQSVWIDNLDDVRLGDHVCVSQGVYFCTGSHDYRRRTFDLITAPISVGPGTWLGAKAILLPGVDIGANCVVAAGSVVRQSIEFGQRVAGNPAVSLGLRPNPPHSGSKE